MRKRDKAKKAVSIDPDYYTGWRISKGGQESPEHYRAKVLGKPVHVSIAEGKERAILGFESVLHRPNKDPESMKSIISKLSKAGVLVPELVAYREFSPFEDSTHYAFEITGKSRMIKKTKFQPFSADNNSLYNVLIRFMSSRKVDPTLVKQLRKLLSSTSRSLGVMHSLGILHGHPHFRNFIPVKSRVAVIDFKFSEQRKVDWENIRNVRGAFDADYKHLANSWRAFMNMCPEPKKTLFESMRKLFYKKLVEKYPMFQKQKDELVQHLIKARYF